MQNNIELLFIGDESLHTKIRNKILLLVEKKIIYSLFL